MNVYAALADLLEGPKQELSRSWIPCLEKCEGHHHARPEQLLHGDWNVLLIQAGRGWGKTRTGAEWTVRRRLEWPGSLGYMFSPTYMGVRHQQIEGESGVLSVLESYGLERDKNYQYNRSSLEIMLDNGSKLHGLSGEKPDSARGPNAADAWVDEPGSMPYGEELWTNVSLMVRAKVPGDRSRILLTGTPKRRPLIKRLLEDVDAGKAQLIRGVTAENKENLDPAFYDRVIAQFAGTRLERQELLGEYLADVEGAMWTYELIDLHRLQQTPTLERIIVAVDPAKTSTESADHAGIVVAGKAGQHVYVLHSERYKGLPHNVCRRADQLARTHNAQQAILEGNTGGDWLKAVWSQVSKLPVKLVTATTGKVTRAEGPALLYDQGKVHHVGSHSDLEDEMTTYTVGSKDSPDIMDAMVWAVTELAYTPAGFIGLPLATPL